MVSPTGPAERFESTDAHSLAALIARDPGFVERRRRLVRIVVAAVVVCALILVAAGIARALRPSPAQSADAPIQIATAGTAHAAPPPTPAPPPADTTAEAPAAPAAPSTGTLHLQHPARPGHVWIDGKKVTQSSATVACGKHKVKVGPWGRARSVDVPCGGELTIAR